MVAHNMLTPLNMRVRQADQVKNINGCYVINEERLNAFSDALFLEVRAKGFLPAMYAHLMSLPQIERLVQLSKAKTGPAAAAAAEPAPVAPEVAPEAAAPTEVLSAPSAEPADQTAAPAKPAARKRRSDAS